MNTAVKPNFSSITLFSTIIRLFFPECGLPSGLPPDGLRYSLARG